MRHSMLLFALACLFLFLIASPCLLAETNINDNYAGSIFTFSHSEITVCIDSGTPPEVNEMIRAGFQTWQTASQGGFSVKFVELPPPYPQAGERKSWTRSYGLPEVKAYGFDILVQVGFDTNSAGAAGWTNISGAEKFADMFISYNPARLQEDADIVKCVILHEAGHALFCDGHSPNPEDIMSKNTVASGLSVRDANTLLIAYPPGKVWPPKPQEAPWPLYAMIVSIAGTSVTAKEDGRGQEGNGALITKVSAEGVTQIRFTFADVHPYQFPVDLSGTKIWYWGFSSGEVKVADMKIFVSPGQLRPGDVLLIPTGQWGYRYHENADGARIYEPVVGKVLSACLWASGTDEPKDRPDLNSASTKKSLAVQPAGKLCTTWGKIKNAP